MAKRNNTLIAEFMGLEPEKTISNRVVYAREEQSRIKLNDIKTEFYEANELQYHSSWDWLMPVVEKIGALSDLNFDMSIELTRLCTLRVVAPKSSTSSYEILVCEECKGIKTVYKTVVEFVKWYNKQQKND